jgi:hypothetical protein
VVVIALVAVLAVVAVLVGRCASGGGDGATPVPSALDAPTVTAIGDAVTKAVEAQSQVVADVYRRIQPSVVEIDVEQSPTVTTAEAERAGLASVIVNNDGSILTAFHVVAHDLDQRGYCGARRRSTFRRGARHRAPAAGHAAATGRFTVAAARGRRGLPVVAVSTARASTTPPRPG